jgi:site-specific DNA recombinase
MVGSVRAGIYCRISQDAAGLSLGVARQEEDCVALCEERGWEVVEIYVDNDVSAVSGKVRPAYRRMVVDIQADKIDAIVAWDPDRLYRRIVDLGELLEMCKHRSISIATVNAGNVDLSTSSGRFFAGQLALMATYEGEHKAERWKRSFRQRREAGEVPRHGSRMFGYTIDGEIVESEAELIRDMAEEVLRGVSLHTIVRGLNARGHPTARGGRWSPATLRNLLRNPRLAGYSTIRGQILEGVQSQWEPILDTTTWQTIAALLHSRAKRSSLRVSLLPGLILCGLCDTPLQTGQDSGNRIYRCKRDHGHPGACGGVTATADKVEEVVEAYAKARFADPRVRQQVAELRSQGPTKVRELETLQVRLVELEEALADAGGRAVVTLLRAADHIRDRIEALNKEIYASAPAVLPAPSTWPADLSARRRLVELVVARVWLDPSPARGGRFVPERVRVEDA